MPRQGASGGLDGVRSGSSSGSERSGSSASDGSDDEGPTNEESKVPRDGRLNGLQVGGMFMFDSEKRLQAQCCCYCCWKTIYQYVLSYTLRLCTSYSRMPTCVVVVLLF